ncbi:S49 family peptidase [uncultured Thiodictyon sp.]|uniref:S49 family peptidase n=1 Tax=uncultured Thiodictyon sp. TaxID=1846217 RepID=UPI0025F91A0A|nr:S49 family peptidase [uncultured Thiodictyon sp.]
MFLQNLDWLIQPEALRSMAAASRSFLDRGAALPQPGQSNPLLSVEDGIGVIAIDGPMMRKPDIFARVLFRAADSNMIGDAIREAGARDDIKAVLLEIDSPGGTVAGTPELAATVKSVNERKPVYAFSSGLMASAAYWVASQARAVYATPSAQVGSIGVVQAVIDDTAALDAEGIKVEVFSVGKYKAMGAPGTPLTDDQRNLIRSNLAEIAQEFHAAVLARGRAIPADAMEGQTFSGRQAQRVNLAGMVPDRAEAMRRLRVYHAAVDTQSSAMNASPEDLLAEARTQVDTLQRDFKAQADLLAEASTNLDSLRGEVGLLTADLETLRAERDGAKTETTTLQTRISGLQASQADFDTRVQTEVARVVASTGTTLPARVTPLGDATQAAELHAQFATITDPSAQTVFWRKLTPEQQAIILKHQA